MFGMKKYMKLTNIKKGFERIGYMNIHDYDPHNDNPFNKG